MRQSTTLAIVLSIYASLAIPGRAIPVPQDAATPPPAQQASIQTLKAAGIITDAGFNPTFATSRAQYVKMLTQTLMPAPSPQPNATPRASSSQGSAAWFAPVFNEARSIGIPLAPVVSRQDAISAITREEAAVLLIGGASQNGVFQSGPPPPQRLPSPVDIGDVKPGDRDAVKLAIFYGLLTTDAQGRFLPNQPLSQGETAVVMAHLLALKQQKGK